MLKSLKLYNSRSMLPLGGGIGEGRFAPPWPSPSTELRRNPICAIYILLSWTAVVLPLFVKVSM